MSNLLLKFATGRLVLSLFIITMCVYAWIVFFSIPSVIEESPETVLFDMSPFGYSLDYARDLLKAIGEEGRHKYLSQQLPIDLIYPGLFAVTYTLMLAWIVSKLSLGSSWLHYALYVPAFAGLFDYIENFGIYLMIVNYPDLNHGVVLFSSIFTISKSVMTIVFYFLLMYVLVLWGIKHKAQKDVALDG